MMSTNKTKQIACFKKMYYKTNVKVHGYPLPTY